MRGPGFCLPVTYHRDLAILDCAIYIRHAYVIPETVKTTTFVVAVAAEVAAEATTTGTTIMMITITSVIEGSSRHIDIHLFKSIEKFIITPSILMSVIHVTFH